MSATRAETQSELKEIKVILRAILYQVERLQSTKRISRRKQNSTSPQDSQLRIEFLEDQEKGSNA